MENEWKFIADFHTHTHHSDGKGTVLQNAVAARDAGLQMVGITNHGPASIGLGVPEHVWDWIRADVNEAERLTGVRVLFGCEANVISVDGTLDVPARVRKDMDIVLAGLHPLAYPRSISDGAWLLNNMTLARVSSRMARRARQVNTKALVEAVYRNDIDIISHPGLKLSVDTAELARACAARGTALEISAGHPHMTAEYVRLASKQGAKFAIGSDAHSPENVGKLEAGERVARLGGLSAEQVLNAVEVRQEPIAKDEKHQPGHRSVPVLERERRRRGV